jgi:drug/metabolite transporter (DMT)-like permease
MLKEKEGSSAVAYTKLFLVIFLWGISPVVMKHILVDFSASIYSAISGFVAAIFILIICKDKIKKLNKKLILVGTISGLFNALASLVQKIGLPYTTPANYAFLENLSCIAVPVLLFLLVKKKPSFINIATAVTCFIGSIILSGFNFSDGFSLGIGEILCAVAGIMYGVNIAVTGIYAKDMDSYLYVFVQMCVQMLVGGIIAITFNYFPTGAPLEPIRVSSVWYVLVAVILWMIVNNSLCWTLRVSAMKKISATTVATIMPFSSVVTVIVSVFLGTDKISTSLIVGGGLILISSIVAGVADVRQNADDIKT